MSAAKSTSPSAAPNTLPISRTMMAASSFRRSRCSSAARRTIPARSATGTFRQVSNPASAVRECLLDLGIGEGVVAGHGLPGGRVHDGVLAHDVPLRLSIMKLHPIRPTKSASRKPTRYRVAPGALRVSAPADVLDRGELLPVAGVADGRVVGDEPVGVVGVVLAGVQRREVGRRDVDRAEVVDRCASSWRCSGSCRRARDQLEHRHNAHASSDSP